MKTYYYQQILKPLQDGDLNTFKKIKNAMLSEVIEGKQLRIVPIHQDASNREHILETTEEVDKWFRHYGF